MPTPTPTTVPSSTPVEIVGRWVTTGPDGGPVDAIAIDPVRPEILYAGTPSGVFKSSDGGETWVPKREGLLDEHGRVLVGGIHSLAIDPTNPEIVYAGTGAGLWKSEDGGESWVLRSSGLEHEDGLQSVGTITIDPASPGTLYAAGSFGVFKTTDGAQSWRELDIGPNNGGGRITVHPYRSGTVFVSSSGILRSTDGGFLWREATTALHTGVHSFFFDPRDPDVIWAGALRGGVFRSGDGGVTWQIRNQGLPRPDLHAETFYLAGDPADPDTLYVATESGLYVRRSGQLGWSPIGQNTPPQPMTDLIVAPDATIYGATSRGVYRSDPADRVWQLVDVGMASATVRVLAIDPSDPDVVLAGVDGAGLYRSHDLGRTWRRDPGEPLADAAMIMALLVDPADSSHVLAACLDGGTFVSRDGGQTWQGDGDCIDERIVESVPGNHYGFAIDPRDSQRLFLAAGGIVASRDDGATWTTVRVPHPSGEFSCHGFRSIAIDPADSSIVFAVEVFGGPTKSRDGGTSFPGVDCSLPAASSRGGPSAILIDPTNPAIIYAASFRGLEKSEDGGETWSRREIGIEPEWIHALAFDPHTGTLYAGTHVGVFRSGDGAATWEPLNEGLLPVPVYSLAIDPRDGRTLLAGTAGGSVQRLRLEEP